MPEEKDKTPKENSELSLEEQLQALLRGLPVKPGEEEPQEKQPVQENSVDELTVSPQPVIETPQKSSETPVPPQASEPKAGYSASPIPISDPRNLETSPKPVADSGKNALTEELAALFGAAPTVTGTPRPANVPPAYRAPIGPAIGDVTSKPIVSGPIAQPPTTTRPPIETGSVRTPSPEPLIATPTAELVFKDEIIQGPKPKPPLLGLSFLQKHTISISIEGTNLRILTLTGDSIETWASVPIEPRFLREGYIANVAGMGKVISKALVSLNISPGKLICSFTSLGSTSRILSLPQSAKKDLDNIIPRELRRASINIDNLILRHSILPVKQGPLRVFILGVPKEPLVAMLDTLSISKFKPAAVELKPLALARAVNKKDAIIAHGERDSLELVLVVDGIPSLFRSIYLGMETTPDQVAARLVEELERTIYFYNGNHREQPLDPQIPIYITGEIANYPDYIGIGNGQVPALDRVIGPLEPPLKLPKDFPTAIFMVNIGLLLKKI